MQRLPLLCLAAALLLASPHTPAQTCQPTGENCSPQTLRLAIQNAHTIATQTPHLDRFSQTQLAQLITSLNKTPAKPNAAADLTLILAPAPPNGIDIGPAGHELATLRVYSGANGHLIWVEHVSGPGDKPWPATVDELLTNFKSTLNLPAN